MYNLSCFLQQYAVCVLHSEFPPPSEGSEPVRKKSQLDIGTLPGDDVHKPQFDTGIGTHEFSILLLKLLIYRSYSNAVCDLPSWPSYKSKLGAVFIGHRVEMSPIFQ